MLKLFIDPGHGGSDPGAIGNGLQEKNLTLQLAIILRDILANEYEDVLVLLSRTRDENVSLKERTDAANRWGANFYLSIHINAGGGTGFESFIYPGSGSPTSTYQNTIHSEVIQAVGLKDRGKKSANFHVLRETRMPALLTENGFIDNTEDANKLKSSSFLSNIARGHANGLAKAFNLKKKHSALYKVQIGAFRDRSNADRRSSEAKSKGLDAIVLLKDGLYKVQIGAFSSKENAEALASKSKKAGFETIVYLE